MTQAARVTLFENRRRGGLGFAMIGVVMVVTSILVLSNPGPAGAAINSFLFTVGAFPGGFLVWYGTRWREVWVDRETTLVTERRHIFWFRFERHLAANTLSGVLVTARQVAAPEPLWRRLLTNRPPGVEGPKVTVYQLSLAGANPSLLLDVFRDHAAAVARGHDIASAGGWAVRETP